MVRISNDLEQWITFFLNGIVETAQHGLKTFKAIIALRQEYDTIVKPTINYTLELARLGNLASGAREVGVRNPSHRLLKCPFIFGLHYKILTLGSRAKNAQKLLQRMYATPIVKARTVEKELDISFSSANRLLKSLTALGILKETTRHSHNRLFVLEKYLNLFRN